MRDKMDEEKTYCRNCDKYTKDFDEEKQEWICSECEQDGQVC